MERQSNTQTALPIFCEMDDSSSFCLSETPTSQPQNEVQTMHEGRTARMLLGRPRTQASRVLPESPYTGKVGLR